MYSQLEALVFAIISIYYLGIVQYVICQTPVDQSAPIKIAIPNLPPSHYQFWLKNYPRAFKEFTNICSETKNPLDLTDLEHFKPLHANLTFEDPEYLNNLEHGKHVLNSICSKLDLVPKSCWGYENNCQLIYLMPECEGGVNEQESKIAWFSQADFGYILDRRRELNKYCSADKYSNESVKSSLECTKFFRTCRGDNLMIKFNAISKNGSLIKPQEEQSVIKRGDIGGWNCDLQRKRIPEEDGQRKALQSWFTELSKYDKIEHVSPGKCDLYIDKQAFILKLDSPANLYHYLSSFLNLYATMHLNNRFSDDNQIIIWDSRLPRSKFEILWDAFTRNPLKSIGDFENKRVCFKKFIFTLMPRTLDGLYYNTKLTPGCTKSGLFDAFNKHVLHKLKISQTIGNNSLDKFTTCRVIKVTLSIRSTPHRRILNQDELATAIKQKSSDYSVQMIDFQKQTFSDQLKIAQNTDILIGIHGAGLVHTLFLPDWAVLYELDDCQENCYQDLARLRGVSYVSPKNERSERFSRRIPVEDKEELKRLVTGDLLKYDKYWNFEFDKVEFLKLFDKAVGLVRKNRSNHLQNCAKTKTYVITEGIKKKSVEEGASIKSIPNETKSEPGQGKINVDRASNATEQGLADDKTSVGQVQDEVKKEPGQEKINVDRASNATEQGPADDKTSVGQVQDEVKKEPGQEKINVDRASNATEQGPADDKTSVGQIENEARNKLVKEEPRKGEVPAEARGEPLQSKLKGKLSRGKFKKGAIKEESKKEPIKKETKEDTKQNVNQHDEL